MIFLFSETVDSSHVSFLWLLCFLPFWKRLYVNKHFVATFTSVFFPVVFTQPTPEIIRYVGDTVTLEAGGKPPLITIVWSTFQNDTVIAQYYDKTTETELIPQYSQRLSLDESTGENTHLSK